MRIRHEEKVRMFARALCTDMSIEYDEFDEVISIIDDLSLREWKSLLIINEEMGKFNAEVDKRDRIDFTYQRISEELAVNYEEIKTFIDRLERSGLYVRGMMLASGHVPIGGTTATFDRIKRIVSSRSSFGEDGTSL